MTSSFLSAASIRPSPSLSTPSVRQERREAVTCSSASSTVPSPSLSIPSLLQSIDPFPPSVPALTRTAAWSRVDSASWSERFARADSRMRPWRTRSTVRSPATPPATMTMVRSRNAMTLPRSTPALPFPISPMPPSRAPPGRPLPLVVPQADRPDDAVGPRGPPRLRDPRLEGDDERPPLEPHRELRHAPRDLRGGPRGVDVEDRPLVDHAVGVVVRPVRGLARLHREAQREGGAVEDRRRREAGGPLELHLGVVGPLDRGLEAERPLDLEPGDPGRPDLAVDPVRDPVRPLDDLAGPVALPDPVERGALDAEDHEGQRHEGRQRREDLDERGPAAARTARTTRLCHG